MAFEKLENLYRVLRSHQRAKVIGTDDGHHLVVVDLGPDGHYAVEMDEDGNLRIVDDVAAWQEDYGE